MDVDKSINNLVSLYTPLSTILFVPKTLILGNLQTKATKREP